MWQRLSQNWVYGALPLAVILLGLAPLVERVILAVFLSLPVYMLHQFEEHDADRFRATVNAMLGESRQGLSHDAVWVVNVVFVWFLLLAVFWLAQGAPAWALVAAYLMLINGAVHIVSAARTRTYNPGLVTSIVLFVPLSLWIFASVPGTFSQHLSAAGLILVLHAGIVLWAIRKPTT
ncbi:MAG: HXXEE domain-containing protein [Pseudomonadota bacterium]